MWFLNFLKKIAGIQDGETVEDFFSGVKSADQVASRVAFNIFYKRDRQKYGVNEYWAMPEETLRKPRSGDCEDQAILVYHGIKELLKKYPDKEIEDSLCVFCVWGKGSVGHAVCAYKSGGKYTFIDTTPKENWLLKTTATDEAHLAKIVLSDAVNWRAVKEPFPYGKTR